MAFNNSPNGSKGYNPFFGFDSQKKDGKSVNPNESDELANFFGNSIFGLGQPVQKNPVNQLPIAHDFWQKQIGQFQVPSLENSPISHGFLNSPPVPIPSMRRNPISPIRNIWNSPSTQTQKWAMQQVSNERNLRESQVAPPQRIIWDSPQSPKQNKLSFGISPTFSGRCGNVRQMVTPKKLSPRRKQEVSPTDEDIEAYYANMYKNAKPYCPEKYKNKSPSPDDFDKRDNSEEEKMATHHLQTLVGCTDVCKIANGTFGCVFSVKVIDGRKYKIPTTDHVAVKVYSHSRNYMMSGKDLKLESFEKDTLAIKAISHQNIMAYYSSFQIYQGHNDKIFRLVLENEKEDQRHKLHISGFFVEKLNCSLESSGIKRSEEIQRQLFIEIGSALNFIHCKYYMAHQDLKPENIGVKLTSDGKNPLAFKLIDFGNSEIFNQTILIEYLNKLGNENNPFVKEAWKFALINMHFLSPDSSEDAALIHILRKDITKVMKNQAQLEVLYLMTSPFIERRMTLDEALKKL